MHLRQKNRLLVVVVFIIFLSSMFSVPFAYSAQQQHVIVLSESSGFVGDLVTVTGSGFAVSSPVTVRFNGLPLTHSMSNSDGLFSTAFTVPDTTHGDYTVQAMDGNENTAYATLTVVPSIALNGYIGYASGFVGDLVTVTGSGFAASSPVTITFDGVSTTTVPSSVRSDESGSFSAAFVVPVTIAGYHTVEAIDGSENVATATFVVWPSISLSESSGFVGDSVTVTGAGFAASSTIYLGIQEAGINFPTLITDGSGSFKGVFTVPALAAGSFTVAAYDNVNEGDSGYAAFTVGPSIALSESSGFVGDSVTVTGAGFAASSPVTVSFGGESDMVPQTSTRSDVHGSFSAVFTIPTSTPGFYTVEAYVPDLNFASVAFTVEPSIASYGLTVNVGANGQSNIGSGNVNWGSLENFVFTPNVGYYVSDVVVNGSIDKGAVSSLSLTVTGPTSVSVSFVIKMFAISVSQGANGVIAPGTSYVNYGGSQVFSVTPSIGYHVVEVDVNGSSVGAVSSFTVSGVTGDTSVTASFAINTYGLTVNVGANGQSNIGSGNVNWGSLENFVFTSNVGYHVADVLVNGSSVGAVGSLSLTVTGATSVSVSFSVNTYGLTVNVGANGQSNLGSQTVSWGAVENFVFTSNVGYHVADVTVNGTIDEGAVSSLSLTVTGATSVSVSFSVNTYGLTVNVGANGQSNLGSQTVSWGAVENFVFTSNVGYHVADVTVNGTIDEGAVSSLSLTVTGATSVSVSFSVNTYGLTVNVGANGQSNIGSGNVNWGSLENFVFTPNVGYYVSDVVVNGSIDKGAVSSLSLTVTGPTSVSVSFVIKMFAISVSQGANGVIAPGTSYVNYGGSQVFSVTPSIGYHVVEVDVNGSSVGAVSSFTVSGVTGDTSVTASFAINTYGLTVNVGANGQSNIGSGNVNWGSLENFVFTSNVGYHVADVLVNGSSVGAVGSLSLTVTGATSVSVSFSVNTYGLTVNVGANGQSNIGSQTVSWGAVENFVFTSNVSYHVADVTVNGTIDEGAVSSLSLTVTGATSVSVSFSVNTYGLTVNVGANGQSNIGSGNVNWGSLENFVFTPNVGYYVSDVVVNGSIDKGAVSSLSLTVTGPTSVSVSFVIKMFAISVSQGANGVIAPGTSYVNYGGSQVFSVTPSIGYHVVEVDVNGSSVGAVSSFTVSGVTGDTSVTASFAINTYGLTVNVGANGQSNIGSGNVNWGSLENFVFTSNVGYHVADVLVNGSSVGAVGSLSLTVTGATSVSVSFSVNTYGLTVNVGANGQSNLGSQTVSWGAVENFVFTSNVGYHVADVTVNGTIDEGAVSSLSLTVTGATSVSVSFSVNTYGLTVNVGANGQSNIGSGNVNWGSLENFVFTPNVGYYVSDVVVNGSIDKGAVSSLSLTVTGPTSVSVSFVIKMFAISVSQGANGVIAPGTSYVNYGGSQVFSVTPSIGYHVVEVDVNGSSVGAVSSFTVSGVTGDTSVTASFAINTYGLTVNVGANGQSNIGSGNVNWGSLENFVFTSNVGYHVADVLVNGSSVGAVGSLSLTVTGATSVSVSFSVNTYGLTVNVGANGQSNLGSQTVSWGAVENFVFTSNVGYHVADVTVNGTIDEGAVSSLSLTVTGATSVSVSFSVNTYGLTVNVGANGQSNIGSGNVNWGSLENFVFTPNVGYYVSDVVVNGSIDKGAVSSLSLTVTGPTSVSVSFVIKMFAISVSQGANGVIAPGTSYVNYGGSQVFSVTPSIGYHVVEVDVNGSSVGAVSSFTVSGVTGDTSVTASFAINTYGLTVNVGANGQSNIGSGNVNWGSLENFVFTSNVGYHVADVLVNGSSVGAVGSLSLTVTGATSVSVSFSVNTYGLTVNVGANGQSNLGSQTVSWGAVENFVFTSNVGYHVADVTVNGTIDEGAVSSLSLTVTGATSVSVSFSVNTYGLTVNVGANGQSNIGSGNVNWGSLENFVFTPNVGYYVSDVVVNGSIDKGAVSSLSLTVTGPTSVSVSFVIKMFAISVSQGANGVIAPGTSYVNYGGSQVFSVTPSIGYHVVEVDVNGSSVGAVSSFTVSGVTGDTSVTASFAINTYGLTVNVGANGQSNIGSGNVNWGSLENFVFTSNVGYHVADVLVNGSSVGAVGSLSLTVTGATSVSVSFSVNTYIISASSGANGVINQSTPQAVDYGGSQVITITPNVGYYVLDVTVNGTSVGAVTSYTVSDVTGSTTIAATFAIYTYTVTVSYSANGQISPGTSTANYGDTLAFSITPDDGYHIVSITVNGESVAVTSPEGQSYNFSAVSADASLTATFAINMANGTSLSVVLVVFAAGTAVTLTLLAALTGTGKAFLSKLGETILQKLKHVLRIGKGSKPSATSPSPTGVSVPTGVNVTVHPNPNVQLTFSQVTQAGVASATSLTSYPALPQGGSFIKGTVFDIKTSASFTKKVTVGIQFDGSGLTDAQKMALKVFRIDLGKGAVWEDVTSNIDIKNNIAYGATDHFSIFGVR